VVRHRSRQSLSTTDLLSCWSKVIMHTQLLITLGRTVPRQVPLDLLLLLLDCTYRAIQGP
jgi:hypothetical protein